MEPKIAAKNGEHLLPVFFFFPLRVLRVLRG
jgi:hypothetical protein